MASHGRGARQPTRRSTSRRQSRRTVGSRGFCRIGPIAPTKPRARCLRGSVGRGAVPHLPRRSGWAGWGAVGIAYRIEPTLGLPVVVGHGRVTEQDSVDHLVQLAADAHWPPGRLHLTDVRTVTSVASHASELLRLLLEESTLLDLENVVIVDAALLSGTTVLDAAASLG